MYDSISKNQVHKIAVSASNTRDGRLNGVIRVKGFFPISYEQNASIFSDDHMIRGYAAKPALINRVAASYFQRKTKVDFEPLGLSVMQWSPGVIPFWNFVALTSLVAQSLAFLWMVAKPLRSRRLFSSIYFNHS
jgi:hypothetical protein